MQDLSWKTVCHWRLQNQYLLNPAPAEKMLEVVQALGGVQAQLMSAAELTLSARVKNLKANQVQDALWQDRSLVKSWFMRGTLHLITAEDYPLYIAAFRTMKHYLKNSWYKYFGVTAEELSALLDVMPEVLSAEGISREALADVVAEKTQTPKLREKLLSGWGALLKPPSLRGLLCFAPSEGQHVRFVQPKAWLGEWKEIESDQALQEIARRFLKAYGAGTALEFGRWLGLPNANAKKVFKALGDEILEVNVEGWQAMALPEMLENQGEAKARVNLLGHFDPYTLMIAPHSDYLLSKEHRGRVYRPQGWITPVVLLNGRIVGIWEQETKSKQISLSMELFEENGEGLKEGIEAEAERLGQFLESPIKLEYR